MSFLTQEWKEKNMTKVRSIFLTSIRNLSESFGRKKEEENLKSFPDASSDAKLSSRARISDSIISC
jgi:hypothetical protein